MITARLSHRQRHLPRLRAPIHAGAQPLSELLTEAEQTDLAAFEVRQHQREQHRDQTCRRLCLDAQACPGRMLHSPLLNSPDDWETTVEQAVADYRSGRALMDQLGADRLLDVTTAAILLAIRRGAEPSPTKGPAR